MRTSIVRPVLCALAAALAASTAAYAVLPLHLTARNSLSEARTEVPVTWAVPLAPEDGVTDPAQLDLLRDGIPVPVQMIPMARWGGAPDDGAAPVMWLLIDLQADLAADEAAVFDLVRSTRTDPVSPLRIASDTASAMTVETGAATYVLSKTAFRLFDSVTLTGGSTFPGCGGISYQGAVVPHPVTIDVEHEGPQRISLWIRGAVAGDLEYTMRLHFFKNLAVVRADFRLENLTAYSTNDGQPNCNDYGSPGSVSFDDLSFLFPGNGGNDYLYASGEPGTVDVASGTFASAISVMQESSGDDNWDNLLSEAPRLQSGVAKRASTITIDGTASDGPNQFAGWLDASGVTLGVQDCWQNFPKAFRARDNMVEAGLFPGEFSRNHELRAGEFKTHTLWIRHHEPSAMGICMRARSLLTPVRLIPAVEDLVSTRAAGMLAPRLTAEFPDYENGLDWQITESPHYQERPWESAAPTVLDSISISQHYGWVDYGDVPTDFEGFAPDYIMGSPYNLKYDCVRGMVQQAYRTDDETWWRLAAAGARHAGDIDMLHTRIRGRDAERYWPDGGFYGHGYHEERGNTNPHRNYMNPAVSMSGPPAGMFLWALVSGDTLVLDSALEVTENIYWRVRHSQYPETGTCADTLRTCTIEPWTCEGYAEVDSDWGRDTGNAIKATLAAYMATGEPDYLEVNAAIAEYLDCWHAVTGVCCNRYHMQATMIRNLGHYILYRRWIGLPEDAAAVSLLQRHLDYMRGPLWDPAESLFMMCVYCDGDPDSEDCDETWMCPFTDNWLLAVADGFAVASLVFDDHTLMTDYALPVFLEGTPHPMGYDSTLAYHFTKEYVNQLGFGHMFEYAWWMSQSGCTLTCSASGAPVSGPSPLTVDFAATASPSNCSGAVTYVWDFGDGQTSNQQDVTHIYDGDGTYAWTMTATIESAVCTQAGTITVGDPPDLPGDCDGNGSISIGEVQRAINMFLGMEAPACGVDGDGNGTVSVGEVQQVINGFLS